MLHRPAAIAPCRKRKKRPPTADRRPSISGAPAGIANRSGQPRRHRRLTETAINRHSRQLPAPPSAIDRQRLVPRLVWQSAVGCERPEQRSAVGCPRLAQPSAVGHLRSARPSVPQSARRSAVRRRPSSPAPPSPRHGRTRGTAAAPATYPAASRRENRYWCARRLPNPPRPPKPAIAARRQWLLIRRRSYRCSVRPPRGRPAHGGNGRPGPGRSAGPAPATGRCR